LSASCLPAQIYAYHNARYRDRTCAGAEVTTRTATGHAGSVASYDTVKRTVELPMSFMLLSFAYMVIAWGHRELPRVMPPVRLSNSEPSRE